MNILFVHQNFPGQYKHLAAALAADKKNQIFGLCENKPRSVAWMKHHGIHQCVYKAPEGAGKTTHRYLKGFEAQVRRGQAAARINIQLKRIGFLPDLICVHPGWGEGLFLRDIFPKVKILNYCEFYYGGDVTLNFGPEFAQDVIDVRAKMRVMNSHLLHALEACDAGIAPTQWQYQNHPAIYRDKISVIFDGIDTRTVKPDPGAGFCLPGGRVLTAQDEVISFVNRNLEPFRGWHIFCRALPEILKRRPKAQIVIVGGTGASYGPALAGGQTYKDKYIKEVRPNLSRVHFMGRVPYPQLLALFQIARVHVYLTYPFVLSWSMLEAMSCGCAVVASDTPPVTEMIKDGRTGYLTDFFDHQALAQKIAQVLCDSESRRVISANARNFVEEKLDLFRVCLPAQLRLIDSL